MKMGSREIVSSIIDVYESTDFNDLYNLCQSDSAASTNFTLRKKEFFAQLSSCKMDGLEGKGDVEYHINYFKSKAAAGSFELPIEPGFSFRHYIHTYILISSYLLLAPTLNDQTLHVHNVTSSFLPFACNQVLSGFAFFWPFSVTGLEHEGIRYSVRRK